MNTRGIIITVIIFFISLTVYQGTTNVIIKSLAASGIVVTVIVAIRDIGKKYG